MDKQQQMTCSWQRDKDHFELLPLVQPDIYHKETKHFSSCNKQHKVVIPAGYDLNHRQMNSVLHKDTNWTHCTQCSLYYFPSRVCFHTVRCRSVRRLLIPGRLLIPRCHCLSSSNGYLMERNMVSEWLHASCIHVLCVCCILPWEMRLFSMCSYTREGTGTGDF